MTSGAIPHAIGEDRAAMERVYFVFPLGVRFEESTTKRAVARVLHVWSYRRRG